MSIPFVKPTSRAAARQEDPLALFEAESAVSMGDEAAVTATEASLQDPDRDLAFGSFAESEPIALESVLDRRLFVAWLEGVAIMEATCAALVPTGGAELGAPETSDILLMADGTIEIGAQGHRGDSVQRLARTLHVLTSGQAIPAPLRLFISKWIAVEGKHSITGFARELAYFARPNGPDLIREVYQRASAELTAKPAEPSRGKKGAAEAPKTTGEKPKRKAVNRRQKAVLLAAAVALVIAVAAGIAAYGSPQAGQGGASDSIVSSLLARAADFARSLGDVKTQIGQLSSQLSAHLAAGDEAPAATPPASPATSPNRTRTAARSSPASRSATAALPPAAGGFLAAPEIAHPTLAPSAAPSAPADAAPPASEAVPAVPPVVDPNIVYTSADQGVNPPKMLYPQLPPPALVLGPASGLNVMEITIADNGLVERVKLVSAPRRLTDMMLLSGAKLWKFTPASKDGQPVKYRIAVSWAASIP